MNMDNDLKICMEMINKVRWYMERKDYNGLRLYLDEREKYINNYTIPANEDEKYMDSLIKNLDK